MSGERERIQPKEIIVFESNLILTFRSQVNLLELGLPIQLTQIPLAH